ncbi:MAG: TRAP transporter substrate-binding protein [Planctomycetales bacterium]|nr:TRAP transporter substrate-binding protein [Planctomycetales bacterium]
MDKKAVSFFTVGAGAGIVLSVALFSVFVRQTKNNDTGDTLVLKLSHGLEPVHPVHKGMVRMSERMRQLSGGKVVIEIYPSGQLGSETENIAQLQNGALDLAKVSAAPLESFIKEMTVFSVPYVFRDEEHYWKVLEGPIGQAMLLKGTSKGLHGVCYYDSGSRNFYTAVKPVLSPDDLKGQKIRVQKSETAMAMVEVFGASPTPIPWGELYTSLQQNVIDGAENNVPSFYTNRHFEVCRHFSLTEHTRIPDLLLMSEASWQKLPAQVQTWLKQAAEESVTYQRQLWIEETEKDLRQIEELGVKIYHPELAPFRQKAHEMYNRYEGTEVDQMIKQIKAVQ